MTEPQRNDTSRLAAYVEQHGLVSAMNDSKWREAIDSLQRIPRFNLAFRVRCVGDRLDEVPPREQSFPWHVPAYAHIEWLEIDPIVRRQSGALDRGRGEDFTAAIVAASKRSPRRYPSSKVT